MSVPDILGIFDAALCNRRQSRILTIHRGEVYPDAFGSKVGSIIAPAECRCSFVPMDPGRRIGEARQSYFVALAFRSRISRSRTLPPALHGGSLCFWEACP